MNYIGKILNHQALFFYNNLCLTLIIQYLSTLDKN